MVYILSSSLERMNPYRLPKIMQTLFCIVIQYRNHSAPNEKCIALGKYMLAKAMKMEAKTSEFAI